MNKKNQKRVLTFSILVFFIVLLILILCFYTPEEIVNKIGIHNAYVFAFIVAFLAGFSALTSFSMVAVLLTLTAGGVNPLFLGLISGFGLAIGDIIMFITSSKGRELVVGKWEKRLNKISNFFEGKPKKILPFFTFFYVGLTPFPNDILVILLALIKYPFKKIYLPLILGDITYTLLITLLAAKGIILLT